MAAPPEKTVNDLSGKWTMVGASRCSSRSRADQAQNKTLSGDFDGILAFQGIGWLTRKAIGLATVTLHITQYTKDGKVHIDIIQKVTGGINATPEFRIFDWQERPHKDGVFGDVKGRSRFVKVADMESGFGGEEKEFLGQGWDEAADVPKIESYVVNDGAGWTAIQVS